MLNPQKNPCQSIAKRVFVQLLELKTPSVGPSARHVGSQPTWNGTLSLAEPGQERENVQNG